MTMAISSKTLLPTAETPRMTRSSSTGSFGSIQSAADSFRTAKSSFELSRLPSYFISSATSDATGTSTLLTNPVLVAETGKTVGKNEVGSAFHVPNKVLADALEAYQNHTDSNAPGRNWHQIVDIISLAPPEVAVQVVSPYRHLCESTREISDYPEHQVFEMESLVEWFAISKTSPLTSGKILFPLQIAPNIAVTNLIRSTMDPPRSMLTAADERALVTFCEDATLALNVKLDKANARRHVKHDSFSKVAMPLVLGFGFATSLAIRSLKGLIRFPSQPSNFSFRDKLITSISFGYAAELGAPDSSETWTLCGCVDMPQSCDEGNLLITNYDSYRRYQPTSWPDFAQIKTGSKLTGEDLYNTCLALQKSCKADYLIFQKELAKYDASMARVSAVSHAVDAVGIIAAISTIGLAALIWKRGYKLPQMPTLALPSDQA